MISLFRDELKYRFLGDRIDRPNNGNIEEGLLPREPKKNDFTVAEAVTLKGNHERRARTSFYTSMALR